MSFPQRLHDLRKKAGLSQEDLANILGVTRQAVQKWEMGTSRPDTDNLVSLAKYFKVTLDWLVIGMQTEQTGQPTPQTVVIENHYHSRRGIYEYKSEATFWGLPLVHIHIGHGFCRAKGIVAIGDIAMGVIAMGGLSLGVVSLGGISLGLLLSLGGIGLGGIALGGCAIGAIAVGGMSFGWLSLGGMANGAYAIGGMATATEVAIGGVANAPLAIASQKATGAVSYLLDGFASQEVLTQAITQGAADAPRWLQRILIFFSTVRG